LREDFVGTIAENLALVRERIERSARASGREAKSVQLVAVSKTKPASMIREAFESGQRDFGENYVQELSRKHGELADVASEIRWHAIGHVQTNKARDVVRCAAVVHSVDSARLAREMGKRAEGVGRTIDVFAQVNVGGEAQKSGCAPDELGALLDALGTHAWLRLRGLMTVPPHTDEPEGARTYFDALVRLRDAHGGTERLPDLSMGMTHDLEVAIACGATVVRVGSAIFGER
jgi:pyridoxal phosphate enzyme (YggS family)